MKRSMVGYQKYGNLGPYKPWQQRQSEAEDSALTDIIKILSDVLFPQLPEQ